MAAMICSIWMVAGCAERPGAPAMASEQEEQQISRTVRAALQKDAGSIDYDTLIAVYKELASAKVPIPDVSRLLRTLIRNAIGL
jgi:hypothetical protein